MGLKPYALILLMLLLFALEASLPSWFLLSSLLLCLWKIYSLQTGKAEANRILISAIAAMILSFQFLENNQIFSRESLLALVATLSLVLCLDRAHSMQIMLVHSSFFALLVGILVQRNRLFPLWVYFVLTLACFLSLAWHHLPTKSFRYFQPLGKQSLKIALPVATLLLPIYFFFPDWRPPEQDRAISGFSDFLEPGRIRNLALSDRLAFRVRFQGPIPSLEQMYWRLSVLEESFGMMWRKKSEPHTIAILETSTEAGAFRYELFPEQRLGIKLPLLDFTRSIRTQSALDEKLYFQAPLNLYQSESDWLHIQADGLNSYTSPPPPETQKLVLETSSRVESLLKQLEPLPPQEQVAFLKNFFQSFQYTLNPARLERDRALDQFLFETKQGFCEHFAAAFASLLQMSGTPARVVTGYQGGVGIARSAFWIVRDSEAHAWTEVYWDQSWHRIDPSLFVLNGKRPQAPRAWQGELISAWMSIAFRWFTNTMRGFLSTLEWLWLSLILVLALVVPIQIYRMFQQRKSESAWAREFDKFQATLQEHFGERKPYQGFSEYLLEISSKEPRLEKDIQALLLDYQLLSFGKQASPELSQQFIDNLKQCRKRLKTFPSA